MWFKDSVLIIEKKIRSTNLDGSVEDVITKYTYVDLKTSRSQDYFNFRDTAKPYCNFEFSPRYVTPYLINPFAEEKPSSYVRLPDRMEKGELVKIVQREDTFKNPTSTLFYFKKSKYDFIFSYHPFFEQLLSPYKGFMVRTVAPNDPGYMETGYRLVATSLNDKILAIFDAWEKNAKATKLEVLTSVKGNDPCPIEFTLPPLPKRLDHTTL